MKTDLHERPEFHAYRCECILERYLNIIKLCFIFFSQRREDAKKKDSKLCAFAPLRELDLKSLSKREQFHYFVPFQ